MNTHLSRAAVFVAGAWLVSSALAKAQGGGGDSLSAITPSEPPPVGPPVAPVAAAPGKRLLAVSDLYRERDASDPRLSPDGQWVAYTVSAADSARDEIGSAI